MPALALTTFTGGIDEKMAVFDVYGQDGQAVLTGVSEIDTFVDYYQGGPTEMPIGLPSLPALPTNGGLPDLALSTDVLQSNMMALPSGISSAIAAASEAGADMLKVAEDAAASVMVTIGGVVTEVTSMATAGIEGLIDTVGALVGDNLSFNLNDVATKTVLATNAINQATSAGMSGLFTAVASSPQFAGTPLANIAVGMSDTLIATSNNKVLAELAASPTAANALNLKVPTFTGDYLQDYQTTMDTVNGVKASLSGSYSQVKSSLSQIKSDWKSDQRAGGPILSAANFKNLSKDATAMIKAELTDQMTAIAPDVIGLGVAALIDAFDTPPTPPEEAFILPAAGTKITNVVSVLAAENPTTTYFA